MSVITENETEETTVTIDLREERRYERSWLSKPRRTVLLFAAAFAAAEAVGAFVNIPAQAAMDALFAFIAVNVAVFGYRTKRTAGLVMAAVFTDRLVVLTLPTAGVSETTRLGMVAVVTVALAYIATWVLGVDMTGGRNDEGYALRKPVVSRSFTSALTVLTGFPLGWLAYEALKPGRLIVLDQFGTNIVPWAIVIGTIVIAAFGEELLYRRLVAAMMQHTGQSQSPFISAFIYAAAFLGTQSVGMIATMFLAGLIFAWSCERTGSIKPVVTAHFIASILFFVALPR